MGNLGLWPWCSPAAQACAAAALLQAARGMCCLLQPRDGSPVCTCPVAVLAATETWFVSPLSLDVVGDT